MDVDKSKIVCLHCHLSGNNREPSIYVDVIRAICSYIEEFQLTSVRYIDVDGGFKIGETYWSFSDYINPIDVICKELKNNIPIIYELGNSLVINVAEYHTKIISHKKVDENDIFVVDGSLLHLPKIAIKNIQQEQHIKNSSTIVVGSTCKESDILKRLESNAMIIGKELVFNNIGAYSLNTLNTLILGRPQIYIRESEKIFMRIGTYDFLMICSYMECFNHQDNVNNDYSIIDEKLGGESKRLSGLYAFVNNKGKIIYIGEAHDRPLPKRIKQHFRPNDTGGFEIQIS